MESLFLLLFKTVFPYYNNNKKYTLEMDQNKQTNKQQQKYRKENTEKKRNSYKHLEVLIPQGSVISKRWEPFPTEPNRINNAQIPHKLKL